MGLGTFFDTFLPSAAQSAAGGAAAIPGGKAQGELLAEELQRNHLLNQLYQMQVEQAKAPQFHQVMPGATFGTIDPRSGEWTKRGDVPYQRTPHQEMQDKMLGMQMKQMEQFGGMKPPKTIKEMIDYKISNQIPLDEGEKAWQAYDLKRAKDMSAAKGEGAQPFAPPRLTTIVDPKDPSKAIVVEVNKNQPLKSIGESPRFSDAKMDFDTKRKTVMDFNTGAQGKQVTSFNVALNHLDSLDKLAAALRNKDMQGFNQIANSWSRQFGGPAIASFDAAVKVVGDELAKAIVGGGTTALGDRQEIANTISSKATPEQWEGLSKTYKELMVGKISELQRQYESGSGLTDFDKKLSPTARRVYRAMSGEGQSAGPVKIGTNAEWEKLPKGTVFIGPDGKQRTKR